MSGTTRRPRWMVALVLTAVVLLFAGIRWRLREMPLERDEGEYAYSGQLILHGIPPYQLAYNMKLPGTYLAYAAILGMFGETASAVHIGLLLINSCTILLVFFLARKLHGNWAGVSAAASYGLLSAGETVMGLSGHATHFVALMATAGLLFLLAARESKSLASYIAAGLCMGLAFVMKQPGIVFVILGAQEVVWWGEEHGSRKQKLAARLGAYAAGAVAPYLAICAMLWAQGVFGRFWFWTVSYASQYETATGLVVGVKRLLDVAPRIFLAAPVVWIFAAVGMLAVIVERRLRALFSFKVSLLLWSFVGVSAGLYYREHYFILLFPAASLLVAKAMKWCSDRLKSRPALSRLTGLPAILFVLGYAGALYAERADFFERGPYTVIRQRYGGNPFPEAMEFGKYINEHAGPEATVAVLGSEPEIYFYARRHSASGYIYMYGLMEPQRYAGQMQQEMIGEIERAQPEYLVQVSVAASWLRKDQSDTTVIAWGDQYIAEKYQVVGVADIGWDTAYQWGPSAQGYAPKSRYSMWLYKRKG